MQTFRRTFVVKNGSKEPMVLYLENFLPYRYDLAPHGKYLAHLISTDPQVTDEESSRGRFVIVLGKEGIAVYPPGLPDKIQEFYLVDTSTGERLPEVVG